MNDVTTILGSVIALLVAAGSWWAKQRWSEETKELPEILKLTRNLVDLCGRVALIGGPLSDTQQELQKLSSTIYDVRERHTVQVQTHFGYDMEELLIHLHAGVNTWMNMGAEGRTHPLNRQVAQRTKLIAYEMETRVKSVARIRIIGILYGKLQWWVQSRKWRNRTSRRPESAHDVWRAEFLQKTGREFEQQEESQSTARDG